MRVKTLAPADAIRPTGPWSLGTRAGDFVFVAGMRGIDPSTNTLVPEPEARIRQAFRNMLHIAGSEGASRHDAVRLVVSVTDMDRWRPLVNKVQRPAPLWRSDASTRRTSSRSKGRSTRR
jgi:enamine deaminase RidA (YjgF/YER057c/UK114 family)